MTRNEPRPTSVPEKREQMFSLIGTMNDKEVAEAVGVHTSDIGYHRNKIGMKPHKARYRKWTDESIREFIAFYNSHTKEECITKYGYTINSLNNLTTIIRKRGYYIPYR